MTNCILDVHFRAVEWTRSGVWVHADQWDYTKEADVHRMQWQLHPFPSKVPCIRMRLEKQWKNVTPT